MKRQWKKQGRGDNVKRALSAQSPSNSSYDEGSRTCTQSIEFTMDESVDEKLHAQENESF